ncbi:MAG TPA: hypothetical protein VMI56_17125 [Reyranella sp.]|nr:hypothetical protein [Reyranella sp.]
MKGLRLQLAWNGKPEALSEPYLFIDMDERVVRLNLGADRSVALVPPNAADNEAVITAIEKIIAKSLGREPFKAQMPNVDQEGCA